MSRTLADLLAIATIVGIRFTVGLAAVAVLLILAAIPFVVGALATWIGDMADRWLATLATPFVEDEEPAEHWDTIEGDEAKVWAAFQAYAASKPVEIRRPGEAPWYYCGSGHCRHGDETSAAFCRHLRELFQEANP